MSGIEHKKSSKTFYFAKSGHQKLQIGEEGGKIKSLFSGLEISPKVAVGKEPSQKNILLWGVGMGLFVQL